MRRIVSLQALCIAAILSIAGIFAGSAVASDNHAGNCYYKTIVTHEVVGQPVVVYVTKYTDCGHAYRVKVVTYKKVTVPVTRKVLVCR